MLLLFTAIFRQNVGGCIYIYVAMSEDGSKKTKRVAESCKFIKYLMEVLLDYTLLYYLISGEKQSGDSLPQNVMHSRLPEDEPTGSKHVEDIKKLIIKILI
jgi:hypothetical protein